MRYKWIRLNIRELLAGLYTENSLYNYAVSWQQYKKFCGKREPFDAAPLMDWRQHLIAKGYAASSVNARMAAVCSIAKELYMRHDIGRDAYYSMKEVRKLPAHALRERRRPNTRIRITPEQMRELCNAPKVSLNANPLALRDRAMMLTLATSGMRISECCAVQFNDIQKTGEDQYVITNIASKKHELPRSAPISPEAYDAILDWIEFRPVPSSYVFTGVDYNNDGILYRDRPLTRRNAADRISIYAEAIGMPHIKPHDFRRFVGTQLAKTNLRQAQKVLGHKNPATTSEHYVLDDVEIGITNDLF